MGVAKPEKKSKQPNNDSKKIETSVSYFQLFRCADRQDYVLLTLASLVTFVKSLIFPFTIIVYSELIAMFIDRTVGIGTSSPTYLLPLFGGGAMLVNATHDENMLELKKDSIAFGIHIGIASLVLFISGILSVDLYNHVALRIVVRFRRQFFEATIRQDVGWHDTATDQNFAVRITDNMEKIRVGIAENVGHFQMMFFDIIISICISFAYGWKLTLAVFIYVPIAVVINVLVAKYQSKLTTEEQNSYANANTVVEESIGAIRTVMAFGGEKIEAERYEARMVPGSKAGKKRGIFSGSNDALLKAMMFMCSSAAFWYGANLIVNDRGKDSDDREYTPAVVMIVSTCILVAADHISRTVPFLESFATARGSAKAIFDVIDAESKIDPLSKSGKIVNTGLKGSIEFKDIFFRYPTRTDVIVLRGFSLHIKEGQTVALVGYSGSGKSTCVQLLQRFYDPEFGQICIDGEDIRNYNIGWLRLNIAVVGQEPVLFQGSIEQNIRHGKMDSTQKEIEEAAKAAGAHDFIIELPHGYDTLISEKGVQLSGGQRQRIAIARALIKNPKILLLDEATSALDYHSEKLVQSALDRASKGRTTLVVSHRLSAICNADHIVFIDEGKIVEQGTHETLVKLGGKYADMVKAHEYDGDLEALKEEANDDLELLKQRKDSHNSEKFKFQELNVAQWNTLIENEKNTKHLSDESEAEHEGAYDPGSHITIFFRILRTARPEWILLVIGVICAALYGCSQPAFSIVVARFYAALAVPDEDELLQGTSDVALISIGVGLVAGVVGFIQTHIFNLVGISLTTRMRSLTFRAVLRQEVGWFDIKENSVGSLSARLAGDAASVQSAIGFPLSNIIQAFTNFVCSFSIAFTYSWELALICLCSAPFMVVAIIFEAKYITKSSVREKEVLEDTSRMATETIAQIRTVAGLHREQELIAAYEVDLNLYIKQIRHRLRFRGLLNSLGMAILFAGYAITITYGGIMVANGEIHFENVMKIANTMLYGLFIFAHSLAFTPAFNAAIISAGRLHEILDREPKIQSEARRDSYGALRKSISIVTPTKNNAIDGVTYQDLYFSYPTRRQQRVLRGFSLEVPKGKTVALVGPSGSGKSTCVQLLQRYYDPDEGKIHIDQEDIHEDLSLPNLRRRLGVVSQEPSLFEKTIAENIAYGDTTRAVPITEVMEAAKMANAHDFITALPQGYETRMGARGTALSGGQKQRIAIARALVRNPNVLLLDEATSALDLQSERIVQAALDDACAGRTCIVIAHRLSTVQNADIICVIQNGRIVEKGSHVQLLAKNGIYAKLHRSQPVGI